jgi:hypothetical protein
MDWRSVGFSVCWFICLVFVSNNIANEMHWIHLLNLALETRPVHVLAATQKDNDYKLFLLTQQTSGLEAEATGLLPHSFFLSGFTQSLYLSLRRSPDAVTRFSVMIICKRAEMESLVIDEI